MSRIENLLRRIDQILPPDPMDFLTAEHTREIRNAAPDELGSVLIRVRQELGSDMPDQSDLLQYYHFKRTHNNVDVQPDISSYIDFLNNN